MSVEQGRTARARRSLRKRACANEFAHRSLIKVHRASDRLVRFAELPAAHDLFVAGESRRTAVDAQALPDIELQHRRAGVSGDRLSFDSQRFAQRPGHFAQTRRPSCQQPLHGFPQVGQEMPAIGNLLSAWTGGASCIRIGAGAVSGHDLDARVLPKPTRNDRRLPAAEDFDRAAPLQIDDDGPVAMTTLDSPVIDGNDDR